jgi:hypothetical protein
VRRKRPLENKWIAQRIDDPAPDLAALARAQGAEAVGPVDGAKALRDALRTGIARVRTGAAFVIDALVDPERDR